MVATYNFGSVYTTEGAQVLQNRQCPKRLISSTRQS